MEMDPSDTWIHHFKLLGAFLLVETNTKLTKSTKSYKMVPILKYIKPFVKNNPKNDPKSN
jgi:hypothetical protein